MTLKDADLRRFFSIFKICEIANSLQISVKFMFEIWKFVNSYTNFGMKVQEIMKKEVVAIKKGTPYREVAETLVKNKISGAPVVDEKGDIVGVVSEKDLFRAVYPDYKDFYETPAAHLDFEELEREAKKAGDKKVEDFMSKRLITADPDTPVLKIGALMIATGIHRVPVVKDKKVIGMVSRRDIYRAILKERFNL
jgi:CBS domain-containing protein